MSGYFGIVFVPDEFDHFGFLHTGKPVNCRPEHVCLRSTFMLPDASGFWERPQE